MRLAEVAVRRSPGIRVRPTSSTAVREGRPALLALVAREKILAVRQAAAPKLVPLTPLPDDVTRLYETVTGGDPMPTTSGLAVLAGRPRHRVGLRIGPDGLPQPREPDTDQRASGADPEPGAVGRHSARQRRTGPGGDGVERRDRRPGDPALQGAGQAGGAVQPLLRLVHRAPATWRSRVRAARIVT